MPTTLDDAIRDELDLIEAIKSSSRSWTKPFTLTLLKTLAVPWLVFILCAWVGGQARSYVEVTFQEAGLNQLTLISTVLALLAATYYAGRWAERRFGGAGLIRRLFQVSAQVVEVEEAIRIARAEPHITDEDIAHIEMLTHQAWDTYVEAMRAAGFDIHQPPGQS